MASTDKEIRLGEKITECIGNMNDSPYRMLLLPSANLSFRLRAVEIPDNALSEIGNLTSDKIRDKISKGLLNLSNISLFEYRLTIDLSPDILASITKLDLSRNSIDDISAVKVSVFLEELDISFNNISSLLPLKELKFLQVLNAQHNRVSSLLPLSNLKSLRFLNITENRIHSFSQSYFALKQLKGVNHLEIDRNPFFMKTKNAFDVLAVGLALTVLNGVNLISHYKQLDRVILNRVRALNLHQVRHCGLLSLERA